MLTTSKPSTVLPALSGFGANLGYNPGSVPYSPGEGMDIDSLSIRAIRPTMSHEGGIKGSPSVLPVLAAYYLNLPIFDSHVYRKMAIEAANFIREYNRVNNSDFFNDYPELRLALDPSDVLDYRAQAGALVAWFRDYIVAVTMYMGAVATSRTMAKLGGQARFHRYGSYFRWSRFHTENRVMSDFWIPKSIKNYITGATRILTGLNANGAPVIAFPIWRTDMLGKLGMNYSHLSSDATNAAMTQADFDVITALLTANGSGAMGVQPNGIAAPIAAAIAANEVLKGPDTVAGPSNPGYIAQSVQAAMNYWRDDGVRYSHSAMSQESSAFVEVFKKLGWVDDIIDVESFDRAIKDNPIGDISTFSQYMVFGSRRSGDFGHRTSVTIYGDGNWGTAGLHLSPHDWAETLATYEEGVTATDPYSKMEQMYVIFSKGGVVGSGFDDVVAHENNGGTAGSKFNFAGAASSEAAGAIAGDALHDHLFADAVQYLGLSEQGVRGMLDPSFDPPVFIDEYERLFGLEIVRQVHKPLIDTWDPMQCGFYVIASSDEGQQDDWTRALFHAENNLTGTNYVAASDLDIMVPVGDAILMNPSMSQSRYDLGPVLIKLQTAAATAADQSVGWTAGLPQTKPYTLKGPEGSMPNIINIANDEDTPFRAFGWSTAAPGDYVNFQGSLGGMIGGWTWFIKHNLAGEIFKHLHALFTVDVRNIRDHFITNAAKVQTGPAPLVQPYPAGTNALPEPMLSPLVILPSKFSRSPSGSTSDKGKPSRGGSKSFKKRRGGFNRKRDTFEVSKPSAPPPSSNFTETVVDPPSTDKLGNAEDEPVNKEFKDKKEFKKR